MSEAQLPTLYHQGKAKSIYSWRVWTEGPNILSEYGQVDGQMQIATKTATPKNVGRSNETTPEEQAVLEAQAMWQKKVDRKYALTITEAQEELIRPMLAADFEKRKNRNVTYPLLTQPKLDGVRALAYWDNNRIEIMSRSGKSWRDVGTVDHLVNALEQFLPKEALFDGEIYVEGETFQQTTRLVKKHRAGPEGSARLVFHVYDVINRNNLGMPFAERNNMVTALHETLTSSGETRLEALQATLVTNEEGVYEAHRNYVADGYEGAMVRLLTGKYQYGARSHDLLKVKTFQDAEYKITGANHGVGKFADAAVFVCHCPTTNKEFSVTPKGTMEERRAMYTNRDEYIGQYLKVEYFELTDDGLPRFPIGLGIRAPEDMPT